MNSEFNLITELHIIVGSVTGTADGTARYIAKQLPEFLQTSDSNNVINTIPTQRNSNQTIFTFSRDCAVLINHNPRMADFERKSSTLFLFCVSNTGVGVLPDNIQPFTVELNKNKMGLEGCRFLLINFGDSSFKTFGQSGRTLDALLQRAGAINLANTYLIDAMRVRYPKTDAVKWLTNLIEIQ